jgi:hypothetical protein
MLDARYSILDVSRCTSPTVINHPSSVIRPLSSVIRHPSSGIWHLVTGNWLLKRKGHSAWRIAFRSISRKSPTRHAMPYAPRPTPHAPRPMRFAFSIRNPKSKIRNRPPLPSVFFFSAFRIPHSAFKTLSSDSYGSNIRCTASV